MNEDKPEAAETLCPVCEVAMEYTDGQPRALCHECGSFYALKVHGGGNYPTGEHPILEVVISYNGQDNLRDRGTPQDNR